MLVGLLPLKLYLFFLFLLRSFLFFNQLKLLLRKYVLLYQLSIEEDDNASNIIDEIQVFLNQNTH